MSLIGAYSNKMADPSNSQASCTQKSQTLSVTPQGQNLGLQNPFPTSFNGIIFRQREMLQCLGVYEKMVKASRAKGRPDFEKSGLTINMRMTLEGSTDGSAKCWFSQYNEESIVNVRFAFIQRNYSYNGYEFMKINFVVRNSYKDLKILFNKLSYSNLVKALSRKTIRFYVTPTALQASCFSQGLMISQLCSKNIEFSSGLFQNEEVEYTAPCTFNGRSNCLAVFTTYRVAVLRENVFIKFISKDDFVQKEYWIESREDWISFQGQDHLLVFKQKLKQVKANCAEIELIRSSKVESYGVFDEFTPKQNNFQQSPKWLSAFPCQSETKTQEPSIQQSHLFMSEPNLQSKQFTESIIHPSLRKRLFEEQEMINQDEECQESQLGSMSEESSNKEDIENERRQLNEIEQKSSHSQISESNSLMLDQSISQSIESESASQLMSSVSQESEDIQNQNSHQEQAEYLKNNYNTYNSSLVLSDYHHSDRYFLQKQLQPEQITVRTIFEKDADRLDLKQNCKNLLNQVSQNQKISLKYREGFFDSPQKDQYVFNWQQCSLNLTRYQENQTHSHFNLTENIEIKEPNDSYSELIEQSPVRCHKKSVSKITKVKQISSNMLVGLAQNQSLHLFRRQNNSTYEEQANSIHFGNASNIFKAGENGFLFTQQNSKNVHYVDIGKMEQELIKTPQFEHQIKDLKYLNNNEMVLLANNSIRILDKREDNNKRAIGFKSNQLFEALDVQSNIAAVGRSDGIVKLYDLRSLKPKSMNNFNLSRHLEPQEKQYSSAFGELTILNNLNVFCQYGQSAFIIDAQQKGNHSIYTKTFKHSERSFIQEYTVNPKILNAIDGAERYEDHIAFNIHKQSQSIVSLYKNYEFHFDAKSKRLASWNQVEGTMGGSKCFYLGFNEFSERKELIYGHYSSQGFCFEIQQ